MINAITSWIFGDIEHLDPAEAYTLTITKQDIICIAKAVLAASAIMAIVMTLVFAAKRSSLHGTSSLGLSARLSASSPHESRSMHFLIDAMR